MSSEKRKIGLVIRPGVRKAVELAFKVLSWTEKKGLELIAEEKTAKALGLKAKGVTPEVLANSADPIVVLGGDGTLIGVAHYVNGRTPTLVGVNFGRLGFLTEIAPEELLVTLEKVLASTIFIGERSMLLAEIVRNKGVIFSAQGVNEAVVMKAADAPLLSLDVSVDSNDVMRLRADGLIMSTATGSTAYSLAAGGSIVYPSLPVVLVTPICPHSLTVRPLILRLDSEIRISIPDYAGDVFLSIDGQISHALKSGDVIQVQKAKNVVKFVRSPTRNYFEILRAKLNWGIANSEE